MDLGDVDRLVVITDEQSHDGILQARTKHAYVVNVAPYRRRISYGTPGATSTDGVTACSTISPRRKGKRA